MKIIDFKTGKEEIFCDSPNHPKTEAHGQISVHFWFGSKNDMKQGSLHLCDDCADNLMRLLETEFKTKNFLKTIEEF